MRVSIGCSSKGRVWSREQGSIPAFVRWCGGVGAKLVDGTISVQDIIANVLIPEEVTTLPEKKILGIDWPAEILCLSEDRVTFETDGDQRVEWQLYMVELKFMERNGNQVRFELKTEENQTLASFALEVGGDVGFRVEQTSGLPLFICIGSLRNSVSDYFSNYPPLVRFVDLCELDGNLLIKPHDPRDLHLEPGRFEAWDWRGVDLSKESIWKEGHKRIDSVQWKAAQHFIGGGFDVVFDDDGPGEAADLVCLKEEPNRIRLVLVHCKFAGAQTAGARISDMVEVCSQAVRSAKWKWRFRDLGQHILERDERLVTIARPSRFLAGDRASLNIIVKSARFKTVEAEILIVQPGLSIKGRTPDQNMLLASAATYLKETIGCELDIACSA